MQPSLGSSSQIPSPFASSSTSPISSPSDTTSSPSMSVKRPSNVSRNPSICQRSPRDVPLPSPSLDYFTDFFTNGLDYTSSGADYFSNLNLPAKIPPSSEMPFSMPQNHLSMDINRSKHSSPSTSSSSSASSASMGSLSSSSGTDEAEAVRARGRQTSESPMSEKRGNVKGKQREAMSTGSLSHRDTPATAAAEPEKISTSSLPTHTPPRPIPSSSSVSPFRAPQPPRPRSPLQAGFPTAMRRFMPLPILSQQFLPRGERPLVLSTSSSLPPAPPPNTPFQITPTLPNSPITTMVEPDTYVVEVRLPGYRAEAICTTIRKGNRIAIEADTWVPGGGNFNDEVLFPIDANLGNVRAVFAAGLLRLMVQRFVWI